MSINKQNVLDIAKIEPIISGSQSIAYSNTTSGLTATTVQGAIDENASNVLSINTTLPNLEYSGSDGSNVIQITGNTTLTSADSGKRLEFWGNITAAVTITLPAGSKGIWFEFGPSNYAVTISTPSNSIFNEVQTQLAAAAGTYVLPNTSVYGSSTIIKYDVGAGSYYLHIGTNPNFSEPAQFDSSSLGATTSFVQRALGNYSAFNAINANVTLTNADAGAIWQINGGTNVQITLPTSVSNGEAFTFYNDTPNIQSILAPSGGFIYYPIGNFLTSNTSITLNPGDRVSLIGRGGEWDTIFGSWVDSNNPRIIPISGSFTLTQQQSGYTVYSNTLTAAATVSLPTARETGTKYRIYSNGNYAITVSPNGVAFVFPDGSTSTANYTFDTVWGQYMEVMFDGSNWETVLAGNIIAESIKTSASSGFLNEQSITTAPSTYDPNIGISLSSTTATAGLTFSISDNRYMTLGYGPLGPAIRTAGLSLDLTQTASVITGPIVANQTWSGTSTIGLQVGTNPGAWSSGLTLNTPSGYTNYLVQIGIAGTEKFHLDATGNGVFTGAVTLANATATNQAVSLGQVQSNFYNRISSISNLRGVAPSQNFVVIVDGYYGTGTAGGGRFYGVTGAASGTYIDNGGTIIVPTGGDGSSAWLRIYDQLDVLMFGADNTGANDSTAAIQAAVSALPRGGIVYMNPGVYLVAGQIGLPNGVKLVGATTNFDGMSATNAQWATYGTWINPTSTTQSCIVLQGHGSAAENLNFIHDQPAPVSGWTPTVYGYCIEQQSDFSQLKNIIIVNASHGIWLNYNSTSGGGTAVHWENIYISAFAVRLRTTCVNDTISIKNIHFRGLWQESSSYITSYIRANTVDWYCGYIDNPQIDGMEFFEGRGIQFNDETCLGNTHSLYNGVLNNIAFNLPQICMQMATGTEHVKFTAGTVFVQTGNAFGYTYSDTQFQLAGDNVEAYFGSMDIIEAGGTVMDIGGGTSGAVGIGRLNVDSYASVATTNPCFSINAGATLNLGSYSIAQPSAAAPLFAGANSANGVLTGAFQSRAFYSFFGALSVTGTGAFEDISTGEQQTPEMGGISQARIVGNINVTTASASTTASLQMSGNTAVSVTGISTAATGYVYFDSGWVDITTPNMQTPLGRLQLNASTSVAVANGDLQLLVR